MVSENSVVVHLGTAARRPYSNTVYVDEAGAAPVMFRAEARNELGTRRLAKVADGLAGICTLLPKLGRQYLLNLVQTDFDAGMCRWVTSVRVTAEHLIGAVVTQEATAARELDVTNICHLPMAFEAFRWSLWSTRRSSGASWLEVETWAWFIGATSAVAARLLFESRSAGSRANGGV